MAKVGGMGKGRGGDDGRPKGTVGILDILYSYC